MIPPTKEWDKTFGGSDQDQLNVVRKTSDGGYIVGGYSRSGISGDKSDSSKGELDYWIIKIDASGSKQWDKTFGGTKSKDSRVQNYLSTLEQTDDGGYILGGYSNADASGDKSEDSRGDFDYWIIKTDASGQKQWDKTYGGSSGDALQVVKQTPGGGFILGGYSYSNISGEKSELSRGSDDFWILKIDDAGNKLWDKTIGGNKSDGFRALALTDDGGYLLGGDSWSDKSGEKSDGVLGIGCYWIVKIDASGDKQWDKSFGSSGFNQFKTLQKAEENGYILGGTSDGNSSGDKFENGRGDYDYWIIRIDSVGNKIWDKTLGGSNTDDLADIISEPDRGFVMGGWSYSGSSSEKTENLLGIADYWIIKVDHRGNKVWDKSFGTSDYDYLTSLQLADGGYILGGGTDAGIDGDKSDTSRGKGDYWIIKTNTAVLPVTLSRFYGSVSNKNIELFWQTASEANSRGFHVERSSDRSDFTEIAFIATKAINGNSNYRLSYSMTDYKPLDNDNYYRLKQEDNDGQITYSDIILLKTNSGFISKINNVYPNPAKDILSMYVESISGDEITINITDINGKLVKRQSFILVNGSNNLRINISSLQKGTYFINAAGKNTYQNSKQVFQKH